MQSGQTFRKILKFDLIVRFRIWISKLRSFRSREGLFDCSEFQCCWSLFWRTPTQRLKDWISNIVNIMIFRIQSLEFNTRLLYYSVFHGRSYKVTLKFKVWKQIRSMKSIEFWRIDKTATFHWKVLGSVRMDSANLPSLKNNLIWLESNRLPNWIRTDGSGLLTVACTICSAEQIFCEFRWNAAYNSERSEPYATITVRAALHNLQQVQPMLSV